MDYNNSSSTSQQQQSNQIQDEIIQLKEDIGDYVLKVKAADNQFKLVEAYKKFNSLEVDEDDIGLADRPFYKKYEKKLKKYQKELKKDKKENIQERDKLKKGKDYYYDCMIT